jgi:hypothetical protein
VTESDQALAYSRIRTGCGFIGVGIAIRSAAAALDFFIPPLFHPLLSFVSIPLAFFVAGHGLARVINGIATLWRSG